jgi:hypothetical protein
VSSARTLVAVRCRRKLLSIHRNTTHRNVMSQLKERRTHVSGARSRSRNWRSMFNRSTYGGACQPKRSTRAPKGEPGFGGASGSLCFQKSVPELAIDGSSLRVWGRLSPETVYESPQSDQDSAAFRVVRVRLAEEGNFHHAAGAPIRHAGRVRVPAVSGDEVGSASSRGEPPPCWGCTNGR